MSDWAIGIDEAGRGPVFGPMIQAAVLINTKRIPELIKLGVKDSKKLSRQKREFLYSKIVDDIATQVEIEEITAVHITTTMEQKIMTLNGLELAGVEKLLNRIKVPKSSCEIIVDQFDKRKNLIEKTILKICPHCEPIVKEKADEQYVICSAASIMAKCQRDWRLDDIKVQYHHLGVEIGSGYTSDPITQKFLSLHIEELKKREFPFVRYSWKTIRNLTEKQYQTSLDGFFNEN